MLTENYPQLQSTQQFHDLSAQITATENQILQDRQTYNTAVMQYQALVRSFPTNIIAGIYGFDVNKYQMFKPMDEAHAYAVPTVSFGFGSI
jgi:LemA protein